MTAKSKQAQITKEMSKTFELLSDIKQKIIWPHIDIQKMM